MLTEEDKEFMFSRMKVPINSIESKLNEPSCREYKVLIENSISSFIKSIRAQDEAGYTPEPHSFEDSPAEIEIQERFLATLSFIKNEEAEFVFDAIRHAFSLYASNGLHQLFIGQENQAWYPKVILDSELNPNDIASLPEIITLYRGTNRTEFLQRNYGQSWTTSRKVAHDFAFKHYENQPGFNRQERVILRTEYPRESVYYANLAPEHEVVVNTSQIGTVTISEHDGNLI
ncbi:MULTISPECIES: hypothetical protein [Pseudomonas]|uniref:hypothetical protein n=1 Tax=Pseudomonas TaxID=286 RepID=UPI0011AF23B3|nr:MULTISPECIES: hypothetical protein [Pseudomonas]